MHGVIPKLEVYTCAGRAVLLIQDPDAHSSRTSLEHIHVLVQDRHAWREIQKMDVRRPPSKHIHFLEALGLLYAVTHPKYGSLHVGSTRVGSSCVRTL
jgi:hypothetical protein